MTQAHGGFDWPVVYSLNQKRVLEDLKQGRIQYADLSQWSFVDEFLCFILQSEFLKFADRTYPNPRKKNEVPIWFLISCQFLLRLNAFGQYHQLGYLMNSGSLLSRIGFNVSRSGSVGFNHKNHDPRGTAVDPDTVRKFFKDTKPEEIRQWYGCDIQNWFRTKRTFDSRGIFILDQTHLVVPDNPNYKKAAKLPVDEHGQWYQGLDLMTEEEKNSLIYHPCYCLTTLLHTQPGADWFHLAGYEWGAGDEDELTQAERFIPRFCENHPNLIKELIMDRGYVSGLFVGDLKRKYEIDSIMPLKKSMITYKDAVGIAKRDLSNWKKIEESREQPSGKLLMEQWAYWIEDLDLWDSCPVPQNALVTKKIEWDSEVQEYLEFYWVLGTTKKYRHPQVILEHYRLRTQIEERYRQFKLSWNLAKFPSTDESLMESHLCFILLTYSLLNLYLRQEDLRQHTHQMIQTLKQEESLGKNVILVYANDCFGVFNLDDYSLTLVELESSAKVKIKEALKEQKIQRLNRSL